MIVVRTEVISCFTFTTQHNEYDTAYFAQLCFFCSSEFTGFTDIAQM